VSDSSGRPGALVLGELLEAPMAGLRQIGLGGHASEVGFHLALMNPRVGSRASSTRRKPRVNRRATAYSNPRSSSSVVRFRARRALLAAHRRRIGRW
jgi:hypothetical protein